MASPSTDHNENDSPTYTKMSVGEVEQIGAHCQAPFCHQLDFLPFRCESCKGKFCLDHRTETAHNCPKAGAWAAARREQSASKPPLAPKPNILNHDAQCSHPQCKTLVNTPLVPGIHCTSCSRDYCLKHRLKEDHDCDKIPRPKKSDGGVADALSKLRAWGAAKKAAATSSSASSSSKPAVSVTAPLARTETNETSPKLHRIVSPFLNKKQGKQASATVQVNALRRTAKGDSKISPEARIYVHVEAVAEGEGVAGAKVPRADAFYSREWSVGKVLDSAAKTLTVTNVNNRGGGEEERLRIFHVDGGRLLPFTDKLGSSGVKSGDTLVLLRGVGAADAGT